MDNLNDFKRTVRTCESAVRTKSRQMKTEVMSTRRWWTGLAGDTFRDEWMDIDNANRHLEQHLNDTEQLIRDLERKMDQADREREMARRKAASDAAGMVK